MSSKIYYGDIEGYYPESLSLTFLNFNNNQKMIFARKTPVFMEYIYNKQDMGIIKEIINQNEEKGIYTPDSSELILLNKIRICISQNKKNICRFLIEL